MTEYVPPRSLFINDHESDCFENNYLKTFSFFVEFCRPGDMDNAEYNSSSVSEVDIVDLDVDDD